MNDRLQSLVAEARAGHATFDTTRSLGAVLAKKALRGRRERLVRRSVVTLSGGAFVALLLIRASISPASASGSTETNAPRQEIAARTLDDAGFARD